MHDTDLAPVVRALLAARKTPSRVIALSPKEWRDASGP
jgi:hypothetical protein